MVGFQVQQLVMTVMIVVFTTHAGEPSQEEPGLFTGKIDVLVYGIVRPPRVVSM